MNSRYKTTINKLEQQINNKYRGCFDVYVVINLNENKNIIYTYEVYKNDKLIETISDTDKDSTEIVSKLLKKYDTILKYKMEHLTDEELNYIIEKL